MVHKSIWPSILMIVLCVAAFAQQESNSKLDVHVTDFALAASSQAASSPVHDQARAEGLTQARNPNTSSTSGGANVITLDVVVTDKSGQPVTGLRPEDFTILDNKQKQSFTSFRESNGSGEKSDQPLTVIVLVDHVNVWYPTNRHEPLEWKALKDYFLANSGRLPVPMSLMVLTEEGLKVENLPTSDGNVLARFLERNTASLAPRTI